MRGGWEREGDEARARRLPSVEDLPRSGDGYDREAVEAAFESFYRHAAEVDRTLEVLEAVAAFQREASSLRADLRSLRAAAWGPVPTLRHAVATTAAARVERGGTGFGAWPRVALYSAFIILVAVGAALADLSSGALVLLVLAAWAIVGLAELAVSGVSGRAQPLPHGYPAWAVEPAADEEVEEELEELEEPEPVVEAAAEPEVEAVEAAGASEEAAEPAGRRRWRRREPEVAELEEPPSHVRVLPVEEEAERVEEAAAEEQPSEELEPVVEAAAAEELAHDELEQAVEALPEAEPEAEAAREPEPEPEEVLEPEAEAEAEPEADEAEMEPAAEAEAEPVAEAEAEPAPEPYETPLPPERQPRLRFWRRRPQPPPLAEPEPEPSEPRHVRIIDVEPASPDELDVPWEGEQPAAEAEEPLDAWERAEVPPEPLFAVEPAAQPPVRASGPGEGVRGNREVPPTTDEALESAAGEPEAQPGPEPQPEPQPTATAEEEQTEEPREHAERRAVFMRRGRR